MRGGRGDGTDVGGVTRGSFEGRETGAEGDVQEGNGGEGEESVVGLGEYLGEGLPAG